MVEENCEIIIKNINPIHAIIKNNAQKINFDIFSHGDIWKMIESIIDIEQEL